MINQIIKLGIFVTLGVWLKHRGKGLLYLTGLLIITWIAHNEYLGYTQQSGNLAYLEISYVIKWLIFLIGIGCYFFFVERKIKKDPQLDRNTVSHPENAPLKDDGFDFLRKKKVLESELDKTLQTPKGKK